MKTAFILLSTLVTSGAYAATGQSVQSQFFYQTDAQQQQVTPRLSYVSQTFKIKTTTPTKVEETGQTLNVKYEYGINEMFSAGAELGYKSNKIETTTATKSKADNAGLTDLTLFGRGHFTLTPNQTLNYGTNFTFSPGDKEVKQNGDTTAMTGGMGFTPYVGYTFAMDAHTFGAQLATEVELGDSTVKDKNAPTAGTTTSKKVTGGNITSLAGFYEWTFDKSVVGGAVTWFGSNTVKEKYNTTTDKTAGLNGWQIMVYPTYKVSENTEILGNVTYRKITTENYVKNGTANKLDTGNVVEAQVGGRFTF